MEAVVFSDYRLLGDFVEHCREEVERRRCGRIEGPAGENQQQGHSQVGGKFQIFKIRKCC